MQFGFSLNLFGNLALTGFSRKGVFKKNLRKEKRKELLAPIETASPPRRDIVESGTAQNNKQASNASKKLIVIVLNTSPILQKTNYGGTKKDMVVERRIGANAESRLFVERRNRRRRDYQNHDCRGKKII